MANADLTAEQMALGSETFAELVDAGDPIPLEGATVTFYAKSVVFGSNTEIKVYMIIDAIPESERSNIKIIFEYDGLDNHVEEEIPYSEFEYNNSYHAYSAKYIGLYMYDARTPVRITVFDGDTPVSETLLYSIETYAKNRLLKSTDEEFKELLRNTMKYADSARVYFEKTMN